MNATRQYQIEVTNRQQQFAVPEGELLLHAMEKTCLQVIQVGCRGGGCGMCKIRVLQGSFRAKRMSKAHITEQDAEAGYVLACRVYPESDLVIESDHFNDLSI